jgi:hypothetical protein
MNLLDQLATVLAKPGLLRHHQPIILLSHMRANTSLFGHILGSHPEIAGYYEMHIGYYSWKSLIRQKLLYYHNHPAKPGARYIFDKVLHDFYLVDMALLNSHQARVIFALRSPEQTIKSIVTLFSNRPEHEFSRIDVAADYYCQRLESLVKMAGACQGYYYFDAEDLKKRTQPLLDDIGAWLGLGSPLTPEFDNFEMSGKLGAGDSSGRLALGKVDKTVSDYSQITLPAELQDKAQAVYLRARRSLVTASINGLQQATA